MPRDIEPIIILSSSLPSYSKSIRQELCRNLWRTKDRKWEKGFSTMDVRAFAAVVCVSISDAWKITLWVVYTGRLALVYCQATFNTISIDYVLRGCSLQFAHHLKPAVLFLLGWEGQWPVKKNYWGSQKVSAGLPSSLLAIIYFYWNAG